MLVETSALLLNETISRVMSISLDVIIVIALVTLFFIYALYAGKRSVFALLISLITTGFLFLVFPYWNIVISEELSPINIIAIKGVIFLIVLFLARFVMRKVITGFYAERKFLKFFEALGLSIVTVALLLTYAHHLFSIEFFYVFVSPFNIIFGASSALFWWLFVSITLIYITGRR